MFNANSDEKTLGFKRQCCARMLKDSTKMARLRAFASNNYIGSWVKGIKATEFLNAANRNKSTITLKAIGP